MPSLLRLPTLTEMERLGQILEEAHSVINSEAFAMHMTEEVLSYSPEFSPLPVQSDTFKPTVHKRSKVLKKRTWKKPKDKPKRPLSAYNLFFQDERNILLASLPNDGEPIDDGLTEEQRRRKHRKTHGKIGFADLARSIAAKWKNCDGKTRAVYEARADDEKLRYKSDLEAWKKSREVFDACSRSPANDVAVILTGDKAAAVSMDPSQQLEHSESLNAPHSISGMTPMMSAAAFLRQIQSNGRVTSSNVHKYLMAECASNLMKHSVGFHKHLTPFFKDMNVSAVQPLETNLPMFNMMAPVPSHEPAELSDEIPSDELFSKDTFFESIDDDDDDSTCTTSTEMFSESDDELERRRSLAEELNRFLYDFDSEATIKL